jgi:predicted nuclease with TOPRIM domain
MGPKGDRAIHSEGGAVFAGDLHAGRDITINHFTEIKNISQDLVNKYSASSNHSEQLLKKLSHVLSMAKEIEEQAQDLRDEHGNSNPKLNLLTRDCKSVIEDLKETQSILGAAQSWEQINEEQLRSRVDDLEDIWFRLLSLSASLNSIKTKIIGYVTLII